MKNDNAKLLKENFTSTANIKSKSDNKISNNMLDENSFDGDFEETPLHDSTHLNDMKKKVTASKCNACDYETHNRGNLKRHHMNVHGKSKTK